MTDNLTKETKTIILRCLKSEIEAFQKSIKSSGVNFDPYSNKMFDIREDYLTKLIKAKTEIEKL